MPSGSFTAMWNQECGLTISHLTSEPFKREWLVHVELGGKRVMRPHLSDRQQQAGAGDHQPQAWLACQFDPFFACSAFCLLLGARAGEDVGDAVVGLVAGKLEDRSIGLRQRRFSASTSDPTSPDPRP